MNDQGSLIACLDIKPWSSEPKEYILYKGTLKMIDNYTLKYASQSEFFESIKADIMSRVNKDSLMQYGLVPVEVTLAGNGIFIRKNDKDIKALFQTISFGDKSYILDDLILSCMVRGGLKYLYLCDKRRTMGGTYTSIFDGALRYVSERLEIDALRDSDYSHVLNEIKTMKRYNEIVRFLLRFLQLKLDDNSFDLVYDMFIHDVSDEEYARYNAPKEETDKTNGYYYRFPYKD